MVKGCFSDLRERLFHSHMGSGSGATTSLGVGLGVEAKQFWEYRELSFCVYVS
jgi:hypothetical protein